MDYKLRSILLPHVRSEVIVLILGTRVRYSKRKEESSVGSGVGSRQCFIIATHFKRGKVVEKAISVKQNNCIIVQLYIRTGSIGP